MEPTTPLGSTSCAGLDDEGAHAHHAARAQAASNNTAISGSLAPRNIAAPTTVV